MVNGWAGGGTEELEEVLSRRLQELPPPVVRGASASPPANVQQPELRVPQDELDILAKVWRGGGWKGLPVLRRKGGRGGGGLHQFLCCVLQCCPAVLYA